MKRVIAGFLFVCFLVMGASVSYGQEEIKAKKMEGHTWHQVVMVKYKPGTVSDAMTIIKDHFMKAGIASNTPGPQIMSLKTGEWDAMFIWTMKSISDMDWEIHPDDEKWWKAMVKQEGNEDSAWKVWQQYLNLVDRSTSYLAVSQNMQSSGDAMGQ